MNEIENLNRLLNLFFGRYYEGLVRFLAVCRETRGPLQTPPKPNRTERMLIENV